MSFQTFLAIGSGGFIGAILRAYLSSFFHSTNTLALGTLGVNLIGSFLMGVLLVFFSHTSFFTQTTKSFLSTGLLGALTTYSTFAVESFLLLQGGMYLFAFLNIGLNAFGTILFCAIGYTFAKYFFI